LAFKWPIDADVMEALSMDTLPIFKFVPTFTDWLGNVPPNGLDI